MIRGFSILSLSFSVAAASCFVAPAAMAEPEPMEYVRVCDTFGARYLYVPGTATCLNPTTGETREVTADGVVYGQSRLADRLDDAIQGNALSLALPTASIQAGHNFAIAGNVGLSDGKGAIGLGGAFRVNDNLDLGGAVGVGLSKSNVAGRAGFNLSW